MLTFGSLRVPSGAATQYREAKAYLSRDPVERRLFRELEHAHGRHFRLTTNHRDDDHFDPNDDTIAWDPYSALRTTRGGRQTPALGLGHEVDHAVENPGIADRLRNRADPRYDDAEERRVILGSEAHAAHTLGESTRHDHDGTTYRVPSPIDR
ncbi:MAG TPA: hypothetical protein VNF68_15625 [Candidatus Baltobacteraceae bacterium]|nr:hypothetical protein [Candidatus Baltobacteraceae bacterium]